LEPVRDEVLIEQMRDGRTDALGILFDRYCRLVFGVAKRILRDSGEAEDLMQEVFLEICRKADLYDPSRGTVKIWLLQYAYHRSFNRRKYLALRNFYDTSPHIALAHLELSSEWSGRELSTQQWHEILDRGMKELSDNERRTIELVAYEGWTVREASVRLQQSYANSRNHYYRGLQKLRAILGRIIPVSQREVNNVRS
jgi:RNA polymerase sigma-70 factor, ECF subfamily